MKYSRRFVLIAVAVIGIVLLALGAYSLRTSSPQGAGQAAIPSPSQLASPSVASSPTVPPKDQTGLPGTGTPSGSGGNGSSATSGSTNGGPNPSDSSANPEENLGGNVLVYVSNLTRKKSLADTVIVLGKAEFKPNAVNRMDRSLMGPVADGASVTLVIYPDGKSGKKISIPLLIPGAGTTDVQSRSVDIGISDSSVRVLGTVVAPAGRGVHARF